MPIPKIKPIYIVVDSCSAPPSISISSIIALVMISAILFPPPQPPSTALLSQTVVASVARPRVEVPVRQNHLHLHGNLTLILLSPLLHTLGNDMLTYLHSYIHPSPSMHAERPKGRPASRHHRYKDTYTYTVYMYILTYAYTYAYTYIYIYIYTNAYTYTYTYTYLRVFITLCLYRARRPLRCSLRGRVESSPSPAARKLRPWKASKWW